MAASATIYYPHDTGDNLMDFALVPGSTLGHLAVELPAGASARETLCTSWSNAVAADLIIDQRSKIFFPVWTEGDDPSKLPANGLIAILNPNKREDDERTWALTYAGRDAHDTLRQLTDDVALPGNIERFAYIPWHVVLRDVAGKALVEQWDDGDGSYDVLKSYLKYTFQRLALQNKVLVDDPNKFSAFNTGLVNQTYDEIFICFEPNDRDVPSWKYAGVCTAGERGLGKRLIDLCSSLPERATYFENVNDLIFDSQRELYVDSRHIIVDNIDRFPFDYLRRQFYDRPGLIALLDELAARQQRTRDDFDALRDAVDADPQVALRMKTMLDSAIDLAIKRTKWNYRTAVPSYFPTADEMSLLLPLCLEKIDVPDAALVVSIAESGNYQGETILTMKQAYLDARLICRPENDWLVP